jgi:hypothetical protein
METIKLQRAAVAVVMGFLAACGGGGGNTTPSGGNPTPTNASPGGIWRGTESVSGLKIIGLVDEAGEFHFIRSDDAQYVGTATMSGNSLTASLEGFVALGFAFTDGSTHGTGTISGTLQARSSINLTTQFRTDGGASSSGTLNLTFDSLYNRPSSLATLSGNFANSLDRSVVTVNSDGSIFSQDPTTGCVINGAASIVNATYNAYHVQFSYGNCTGQAAVLNGVQFTGMATLDNTVTPEQAIIGVTGQAGGVKYAVVLALNRT